MPKRGFPTPQPDRDGQTFLPEDYPQKIVTRGCPHFRMTEQESRLQKSGQTATHPLKRYYRVDEVAVYFSISVRTVYRLLDEGDLQTTRIRGCVRVSAEEIGKFEEKIREKDS
jgi:excisionase family DNA binding protein